jgi:hypothetical protein
MALTGQVIALKLDFVAQVLGHLFEGLNKVIADTRALGTRSALLPDLPTLSIQFGRGTAAPLVSFPSS